VLETASLAAGMMSLPPTNSRQDEATRSLFTAVSQIMAGP